MSLKVLRASKYLCKMLFFVQHLNRVLASPPGFTGLPSILWGLSNSLLILLSGGWCVSGGRMSEDGCWHQSWPSHTHASSCLYKCTHTKKCRYTCNPYILKIKKSLFQLILLEGLKHDPCVTFIWGPIVKQHIMMGTPENNNNNNNNNKTIELMSWWNRRGEGSAEFPCSLHGHTLTTKTAY